MSRALTISRWRILRFLIVLAVIACHSETITGNPLNVRVILVNLASSQLRPGQQTKATVTVMDSAGKSIGGLRISWASSNSTVASINDTSAIVTALAKGSTTISASTAGVTGSVGLAVLDAPPPVATKLALTMQPAASATSGQPLAQQPVIQLQDANSNAVSQPGVVVTVAIASGGGTLSGTTSATTNANGIAAFTNLAITGSGPQTLQFTAPNLTSITSAAINVSITPPVPTKLAITTQPAASATSGQPFAQQPVIQLQDANSNAVSQSGVVVTVAIASGGGTLSGTATATTNANGTAMFSNLAITGSGSQTLQFTAPNLSAATSAAITVTVPSPVATKLAITAEPSATSTSGQPLAQQPVIQLQDANSNAVSQSGMIVTVAIATGGGTLNGTTTATTNASGVATFTDLAITGSGAQTLLFAAPNLSAATSTAITVTVPPPVAAKLAITTQPSATATSGQLLAQQPVIQLRDANNNAVSQSGVVVTAAIASGGGTLSGTATATTNTSGIATFTNLSITGSGAQTLQFTASNLTAATSSSITVTVPPPPSNTCTNEPAGMTAISDQPWNAVPPMLNSVDAYGWGVDRDPENVAIVSDPTAPRSPNNVAHGIFNAGAAGGTAPFRIERPFGTQKYTTVFECVWFMHSSNFTDGGNLGTKVSFYLGGGQNNYWAFDGGSTGHDGFYFFFGIQGGGGDRSWRSDGVTAGSTHFQALPLGVWHKYEILTVSNTPGQNNGILRVWVDGQQILNSTDVAFWGSSQTPGWTGMSWEPVYGGGLNPVPVTMYQAIDHWYVSGK